MPQASHIHNFTEYTISNKYLTFRSGQKFDWHCMWEKTYLKFHLESGEGRGSWKSMKI